METAVKVVLSFSFLANFPQANKGGQFRSIFKFVDCILFHAQIKQC